MKFSRALLHSAALAAVLALSGCSLIERAGVGILAKRAKLPDNRIERNISYDQAGGFERSLDLFLSGEPNAPVLVFVHGGGWDSGDKDLRAGRLDVYGNIGRFYASRGITTAVINYRLQPKAAWRTQAEDVAHATAWVRDHIAERGGDPGRIVLMGHSAGAHLASLVALNQGLQEAAGLAPCDIDGLVAVAGAALDLLDEKTYDTEDPRYYEQRFGPRANREEWAAASPLTHADETDPAVLVLCGSGESPGLRRQSERFHQTLSGLGVQSQLLTVPGQNHQRIVLAASHPKSVATAAIVQFVQTATCRNAVP
jgi:acetyl esterase/lipase